MAGAPGFAFFGDAVNIRLNDPKLIQLRGANFALYSSGIKRGHAEAGQEYADNFGRIATQYESAVAQCESAGDTVRAEIYRHSAVALRTMEGQARAIARDCSTVAGTHLDRGCGIIQKENADREAARVASLAPDPKLSWWRRTLNDFVRIAG